MTVQPLMAKMLALGLLLLTAAASSAQTGKTEDPTTPKSILSLFGSKQPADAKAMAAAADVLDGAYQGQRPPEAVRMLTAILRGSQMGPGEGWFGPGESRYSWKWLVERCGGAAAAKAGIGRKLFPGADAWFARLDRNKNGVITQDDLDWSERNQYMQISFMLNHVFRRLNMEGDGRLTKDDLLRFFEKAADGKNYLASDDFRDAMLAGAFSGPGGMSKGDAPSPTVLVRGLFAGEIGSMNEGPHVDQPAPNFSLRTVDGKETVELAKLLGKKPVVLVFGNFSCGPFRSMYPDVESVYERWKNETTFVMVYVREAHPTDGWHMESNARAGVSVKQPTTLPERVKVAGQFCQKLKTTMRVVVDELNDPVGHAYSGMPARLYVIDPRGKVAYKSGRGPFGFRAGEMEQALVMTLLETMTEQKLPADK